VQRYLVSSSVYHTKKPGASTTGPLRYLGRTSPKQIAYRYLFIFLLIVVKMRYDSRTTLRNFHRNSSTIAAVERARSRVEFLRQERPGLHRNYGRLTVRSLTVLFKNSPLLCALYTNLSHLTNFYMCYFVYSLCVFVAS